MTIEPNHLRDVISQSRAFDWIHSFVINDKSHCCANPAQCTCHNNRDKSRDSPYRLLLYSEESISEGMPIAQAMLPWYHKAEEEAERYAERYPDKYMNPEAAVEGETEDEMAGRKAEKEAACYD